jgi:hypothetical protein
MTDTCASVAAAEKLQGCQQAVAMCFVISFVLSCQLPAVHPSEDHSS